MENLKLEDNYVDGEIIEPLVTLDQVLNWEVPITNGLVSSVSLRRRRQTADEPRLLICHDMKGGYLEDKFIQGTSTVDTYRFFHWSQIDVFVYFSHNFITIPPPVWIDAAHLHGVPVLGTLITEDVGGFNICDTLLSGKDPYVVARFVQNLAKITSYYKFDGWLVNIENKIEEENVRLLQSLVHWLMVRMHESVPGSLVLWYDSVMENGALTWQNQLNANNKIYFEACDGIYLNYNWTEEMLGNSATLAGKRATDVYAGIDVFGRGTFGGGGFNTDVAVKEAFRHGLSVAIFAHGWTHEKLGARDFLKNEYKFWNRLLDFGGHRGLVDLPFASSFCQGFGNKVHRFGKVFHSKAWSNLSLQQYQASGQSVHNGEGSSQTLWIYDGDAFHGGSCLKLSGNWSSNHKPFKIFHTYLNVRSSIIVSYTYKCLTTDDWKITVGLQMTALVGDRLKKTVFLFVGNSNSGNRIASNDISNENNDIDAVNILYPLHGEELVAMKTRGVRIPDDHEQGWISRFYLFPVNKENIVVTNLDLDVSCSSVKKEDCTTSFELLLGQLQLVPLSMLFEQPPLLVSCSHVETIREPAANMQVSSVVTWTDGGASQSLVDSYDVFCQVKWSIDKLVDTNPFTDECFSEIRYVNTTRRRVYKMKNFLMSSPAPPGHATFKLRFIVRENLIGLTSKDIEESAFHEITF